MTSANASSAGRRSLTRAATCISGSVLKTALVRLLRPAALPFTEVIVFADPGLPVRHQPVDKVSHLSANPFQCRVIDNFRHGIRLRSTPRRNGGGYMVAIWSCCSIGIIRPVQPSVGRLAQLKTGFPGAGGNGI